MKRALMYATVASMIDLFNMNNIRILQDLGYKVDVAANFEKGNVTSKERVSEFKKELNKMDINYYHIPIPRSIYDIDNLKKSYNITKDLKNKNKYDLVHCHTPIGSVVCRLVFKNSKSRMIYTAHGFHFYSGAPLKNWVVYYPIEKLLSKYTNTLITINQEDHYRAKKFNATHNYYIPGVGIDVNKYNDLNLKEVAYLRKDLSLDDKDFVLFSIGELNENKNHEVVIQALAELENQSVHYIIAGQGPLKSKLKNLAKELNIDNRVHLLGYRNDIPHLLNIADVFIFPSLREGLSVSVMEAMASKLPVIASSIRGNKDLVIPQKGGILFEPDDVTALKKAIQYFLDDPDFIVKYGNYNSIYINNFSNKVVSTIMEEIYS